jgi:cyanophycinase-like exopeptidase
MKIKLCVMVAFSLILLNCIGTGWAKKEPVLDDDGNVITEAEIKENMGTGYRKGCIFGGGIFAVPSLLAGLLCFIGPLAPDGPSENDPAAGSIFIAASVTAVVASHYIGKHLDRRRAISRIAQQKGWIEKNPALDDDGYLITRAEIEANMGSGYRKGCAIGGGFLSAFPSSLGGFIVSDFISPEESKPVIGILSAISFEAAGITASYYIGKHFDRQRAINRIKALRRQKKQSLGEQEMTDVFCLQLLKVTF